MNDAVLWGSIASVGVCIIIFVYLAIMGIKKINTDHSED